MQFFKDLSWSTFTAGFVAVLVGFTSSIAIVFQAAQAFGATQEMLASWVWAISIGMGLTTAIPSLIVRKPVMVAWSTPGAAVLASAGLAGGFTMGQAVGAFMASAALIVLIGASGWFEALTKRIPLSIASALLAGVLARFALDAVGAVAQAPVLVLAMALSYLLGRRWWPRWSVPVVLLVGMAVAAWQGQLQLSSVDWTWAVPVWVSPSWSWAAMVSVALPLFVVTMASQNLPGVAAQRACGYEIPISPVVGATGLASFLLAPFGGYALNLAAITAAICMGKEAHADPSRRYTASVAAGLLYIALGLAGGTIVSLMAAFPQALILAVAGLALLGTMASGLAVAVKEEQHREAALLTFLVTLSGVTLMGVGSAFWGVVVGGLAQCLWTRRQAGSH